MEEKLNFEVALLTFGYTTKSGRIYTKESFLNLNYYLNNKEKPFLIYKNDDRVSLLNVVFATNLILKNNALFLTDFKYINLEENKSFFEMLFIQKVKLGIVLVMQHAGVNEFQIMSAYLDLDYKSTNCVLDFYPNYELIIEIK